MKTTKDTDNDIRMLMRKQLPEAPGNTWFVRKLMNRLPDKPARRRKSPAEIMCYILGVIGVFAAWGYSLHTALAQGLTIQTVAVSAILLLLTLFCIGMFAVPALRRSL